MRVKRFADAKLVKKYTPTELWRYVIAGLFLEKRYRKLKD